MIKVLSGSTKIDESLQISETNDTQVAVFSHVNIRH